MLFIIVNERRFSNKLGMGAWMRHCFIDTNSTPTCKFFFMYAKRKRALYGPQWMWFEDGRLLGVAGLKGTEIAKPYHTYPTSGVKNRGDSFGILSARFILAKGRGKMRDARG